MIYLYIAIGILVLVIIGAYVYLIRRKKGLRKRLHSQSPKVQQPKQTRPAPKPAVEQPKLPKRPKPTKLPKPEENPFTLQLDALMEKHMANSNLTVEQLASEMMLGRTTFFHKMKQYIGISPVEYIRETRVKKAAYLLTHSNQSITDISHQVGLDDSRYLSKCFKHTYGVTPSEYRQSQQKA